MNKHRTEQDRPSGGVNGTISGVETQRVGACEACLEPFRAGIGGTKRFCSSRCRLLSWAVDALAKALKEGKAEGLRGKVNAIAGEFKIEVVHRWDGRRPA